jgi:hypothetical protein
MMSTSPRLWLPLLLLVSDPLAQAAPTRVAVIGAQMVHSDKLQRSQEWPAMFQKMVGADYDVQNFGDCCSSVSLNYPKQPETHPYLNPPDNPAFKPGFHESVAFMPEIVIIGPWGKHDRELTTEVFGGTLDPAKFAADYETMIMTYQTLPTHPKIFASLPIPIPFGMASGVVNDVILPATKMVLAKHPEIPVIDLWAPFVGHRDLYIQDAGNRAGTHVTPTAGLMLIATTTFAVWKQTMSGATPDAGAVDAEAASPDAAAGGAPADTGGAPGTGGALGTGGATGAGGATGGAGPSTETGGNSGGAMPAGRSSSGCSFGGNQMSPFGLLLVLAALSRSIRIISFLKRSRAPSNTR